MTCLISEYWQYIINHSLQNNSKNIMSKFRSCCGVSYVLQKLNTNYERSQSYFLDSGHCKQTGALLIWDCSCNAPVFTEAKMGRVVLKVFTFRGRKGTPWDTSSDFCQVRFSHNNRAHWALVINFIDSESNNY